jgi:Leucine-rich repeat (LRR) protein
LHGANLQGSIHTSVKAFTMMVQLNLANNYIHGSIPGELKDFKKLVHLDLSVNQLTGLVPPLPWAQYVGGCALSQSVSPRNQFSCPLPPNSSQCLCPGCGHTGPPVCRNVPPTPGTTCTGWSAGLPLAECSAWKELFDTTIGTGWIHNGGNRLNPCGCNSNECTDGHITELDLSSNNLRGRIPVALKDMTELTKLDLSSNKITGSIPTELKELKKLTFLGLDQNLLTGLVPALSWVQYSQYDGCSLQDTKNPPTNAFACPLPADSDQCKGGPPKCVGPPTPNTPCTGGAHSAALPLAECSAWLALFDATKGTHWSECSANRLDPCGCNQGYDQGGLCAGGGHIIWLHLENTNLQGRLPAALKDFTELTTLQLDNNQLTGPIPVEINELKKLTNLRLDGNKLTGLVPALNWTQLVDGNNHFYTEN